MNKDKVAGLWIGSLFHADHNKTLKESNWQGAAKPDIQERMII